jgi:ParB-like chromosome segregation protein Spo0J
MRVKEYIKVSSIKMDRFPMNPSTLSLIDYLRSGGDIPPIKVAKLPKGGFIIRDGRHRVLAHKLLGMDKILATFSNEPMHRF